MNLLESNNREDILLGLLMLDLDSLDWQDPFWDEGYDYYIKVVKSIASEDYWRPIVAFTKERKMYYFSFTGFLAIVREEKYHCFKKYLLYEEDLPLDSDDRDITGTLES